MRCSLNEMFFIKKQGSAWTGSNWVDMVQSNSDLIAFFPRKQDAEEEVKIQGLINSEISFKGKGGRGAKSPDARRNSPRIAIAPSSVAKVDAIAQYQNKSRADVLEELIDKEFRAFAVTADEAKLEATGLIE